MTVELSSDPGAGETELELRHLAHVPDDLWDQYGPGAVGVGWDLGLMGLDVHLSSGDSLDPGEVRGWESSPGGRAFIHRSSTGWSDASIAGGAEADLARASAERVTAFYTVTEE